jgi:tRNA pseudouridine55 synthase
MDGIILVDKPPGITSAEVVRRVKSRVKPARVGHLGTLDPIATGLLPVLIGEATKLAPMLEGGEKEYEGLIRLGADTETHDREGKVVRTADVPPLGAHELDQVARRFTGKIVQTPPVYSAIKRGGVPLYRLARKGVAVEPPAPREVEVHRLSLWVAGDVTMRFHVVCSTGTYLRALARDIAEALGTVGHLYELRRLRSGHFTVDAALPLDDLLARLDCDDPVRLIALREALPELPEAIIDRAQERMVRNGDARALDSTVPARGGVYKVVSGESGDLVAIARSVTPRTAAIVRIFRA